ncbi:sensor histidine kinase [Haloarchaeobius baliensis]|uniref:sensor histidine kinase n=1 Tax=Haloarchaeobius baliensis TaxID=1670458 RepID=UPI003F884F4C
MNVSDRLLRNVVETVPMEVAILDRSGTVVYTNERWRRFGLENGLAGDPNSLGENYLDVLGDDEEATGDVRDAIVAVLDGDDTVHQFEYPCHSPEAPRWFVMYVTGVVDEDGDRYAHLGHLDITERKLAELSVADRNERLQTVARVLSHDLRNPLNVASAYVDLLAESGDLTNLDDIRAAHGRMSSIIADALVLARGIDTDELETVSLERTATESWAFVEVGSASLEVTDDLRFVADESLLGNLLENLVRNSVEHGTADGQLTVRVGVLPTGDGFYVEDDGRGIDPEIAGRVFDAGFTTAEDNTGFGLAIVDTVASAHGWTVTLVEPPGGGVRFEFGGVEVLPRSTAGARFDEVVGEDA